jgi:hypothetical protein
MYCASQLTIRIRHLVLKNAVPCDGSVVIFYSAKSKNIFEPNCFAA